MAHFQQHANRVDEYGNPIPGDGHHYATGGHGRQAGYGCTGTGTGVHDAGGHGGSGQPAFGATGTGVHDAGGAGGYGPMGTGPHTAGHGITGTGTGGHTGGLGAGHHTGMHGITGTAGTHGADGLGTGHTDMLGTGTDGTGHTGIHGATRLGARVVNGHDVGTGVDTGGLGGAGNPGPFRAEGLGTGHTDMLGTGTHGTGHDVGTGVHTGGLGGAGNSGPRTVEGLLGTGHTGIHDATMLGAHGTGHDVGTGIARTHRAEHKTGGILHRSGSSSSSSSEDDGMGGRRKKGTKEKIKEKLPGGHKDSQYQQSAATGGYGPGSEYTGTTGTGMGSGGTYDEETQEKGMMGKVKEKLPCGHKEHGQQHTTTTATGGYAPGRTRTTGTTERTHEKKGIMDKIKEKLPGGR